MILLFKNVATEDIFNGKNTKRARQICPERLWKTARRKLDQIDSDTALQELLIPPGNILEALTGIRKDQ